MPMASNIYILIPSRFLFVSFNTYSIIVGCIRPFLRKLLVYFGYILPPHPRVLRILFFPHKTNGLQFLLLVPSVFETPTQTSHIQAICVQRKAEHGAVPESFLLGTLPSPLFLFDLKCTFQALARRRLTSFTIHKERLDSDCMITYLSPLELLLHWTPDLQHGYVL